VKLMADRFIESHIRQLPVFAKLPPEHVAAMAEAFRGIRLEAGEYIFHQGEPTRGMYMFINGRAQLIRRFEDGSEQILGVVGPNQYLNDGAMFTNATETASLRVLEQATILFASKDRVTTILSHHPEIKPYLPIPAEVIQTRKRETLFRGQRDNETVLMDTRRHWWAYVRKVWLPGLILGILLIIAGFMPSAGLGLVVALFGLIIPGAIMGYFYLEWQNDHVIITDQRVIRIERNILTFNTNISEIPIARIQEVNADLVTSDPFSRIFGYGTVILRTAGEAGNIRLNILPHPNAIQKLIFDNRNRIEDSHQDEQRNTIRAEVDKVLGRDNQIPIAQQSATEEPIIRQQQSSAFWTSKYIDANGNTVYRKHRVFYYRKILLPVLWMLATIALIPFTAISGASFIIAILGFFLFILGALWFYWVDWDWRNDIYVVGNETIQLIHKRPLWLQNEQDQILLSHIDNVVSEKSGLMQSLFDYGDVRLLLIGDDRGEAKVFQAVTSPQEVQAEITRRQTRLKRKEQEQEERKRRDEIAEYLSVYHETVSGDQGNQGGQAPYPPAQSAPPSGTTQPRPPIQPRQPGSNQPPRRDGMRPPNVPRVKRDD
jgi:membrane protein YdbS with pleckstrin-like domain